MHNIVFILLAIQMTNSSSATGLLVMIASLPNLFFSVYGGVIADKLKRKKIMIYSDCIRGCCVTFILIMLLTQRLSFGILCATLFLLESVSRFYYPAYMASITNIVGKDKLIQARSFSTSTWGIVNMLGPALSSILVSITGYITPLLFDSCSYFFSGWMVSVTEIQEKEKANEKLKEVLTPKVLLDIKEGFYYLNRNIILLKVFIIYFFLNFFLGFFEVAQVFFVKQVLGLPAQYYGYLKTIVAVSVIISGLVMVKAEIRKPGKLIIAALLIVGACCILFGMSTTLMFAMIWWGVAAFFNCIMGLLISSFYGLIAEDAYRGRIIGIGTMIYASIIPLSSALSGMLMEYISAKWIFIGAGIGLILLGMYSILDKELLYYEITGLEE